MNAALHWAMVDNEETLIALVRSEHFIQQHVVCNAIREALDLGPIFFLTDKSEFSIPEWETWFAFGVPALEIVLVNRGSIVSSEPAWTWERIEP
jgi:hypothetical protein